MWYLNLFTNKYHTYQPILCIRITVLNTTQTKPFQICLFGPIWPFISKTCKQWYCCVSEELKTNHEHFPSIQSNFLTPNITEYQYNNGTDPTPAAEPNFGCSRYNTSQLSFNTSCNKWACGWPVIIEDLPGGPLFETIREHSRPRNSNEIF